MVSRQARAFADAGYAVILPDLLGTGDSPAALAQATWADWRDEILYLVATAREAGYREVVLWGLRLGCVLAVEVAAAAPAAVAGLLLWQPLQSGRQQLAQFLRLATAGALLSGKRAEASPAALRAELAAGRDLDIAGYHLSPALYTGIEGARLDHPLPADTALALLEVVPGGGRGLSAASQKQADSWAAQGTPVVADAVAGEAFWATQELGFADYLLDRSVAELEKALPGSGCLQGPAPVLPLDRVTLGGRLQALCWQCRGDPLVGMLHPGDAPGRSELGVVVVVGGPQYRVGSHRQFFRLATALAAAGIPVLRFDYRGMGDAAGELGGFLTIGPDIRSAVDAFQRACPSVRRVVLWGLCDAATAAFAYAPTDERVHGLVVANPWVYSHEGAARVRLASYYRQRLADRDFWARLISGKLHLGRSAGELVVTVLRVLAPGQGPAGEVDPAGVAPESPARHDPGTGSVDLASYLATGAAGSEVPVLLILSDRDYTAQEFLQALRRHKALARAMSRRNVRTVHLSDADHTFSQPAAWARVEALSSEFLRELAERSR